MEITVPIIDEERKGGRRLLRSSMTAVSKTIERVKSATMRQDSVDSSACRCSTPAEEINPQHLRALHKKRESILSFSKGQQGSFNKSVRFEPAGDGLTESELTEFRQIFEMLDEDASGTITSAELAHHAHSMGLSFTKEEIEKMIAENDIDQNGDLDFKEFCAVLKRMSNTKHKPSWEEVTQQCFDVFDRNGLGYINETDFNTILETLGEIVDPDFMRTVFDETDVDGNGLIEYEEFSAMVRNYMKEEDLESIAGTNNSLATNQPSPAGGHANVVKIKSDTQRMY